VAVTGFVEQVAALEEDLGVAQQRRLPEQVKANQVESAGF